MISMGGAQRHRQPMKEDEYPVLYVERDGETLYQPLSKFCDYDKLLAWAQEYNALCILPLHVEFECFDTWNDKRATGQAVPNTWATFNALLNLPDGETLEALCGCFEDGTYKKGWFGGVDIR